MERTIGIDLGTTFCAVASVDENGKPILLKNSQGEILTPSVICFEENNILIGAEAKEMQGFGEDNIVSFFKRSMGDPNYVHHFFGNDYSSKDLSGILLKKLKDDAENILGEKVNKVVITVPAYFNNLQREATIQAANNAGLEVLRIINEPTAAAIAYGVRQKENQTILVYDLGGGTFDITLLKIENNALKVIGTDGDHNLGGKDWDDRIISFVANKFNEEFGLDPLEDNETMNDLFIRAENAKKQLSSKTTSQITLTYEGNKGRYEMDKETFEELTKDLLDRTQMLTENLIQELDFSWENIDGVLLVGGSTKMPMVSNWIKNMSGKEPLKGINVDMAVAMGAAIQANLDANKNIILSIGGSVRKVEDVMSHSLGLVAENEDRSKYINSIIISKNNSIPSIESRPYQTRTRERDGNELEVYMVQGESERPLDCTIIGKYTFSGIEHTANSHAVIDVQYSYDQNGIIDISAIQRSNNKSLELTIEPVPDDISWMDSIPREETNGLNSSHLSILIAIDLSYSMEGEPLEEAKKAALGFLEKLDLSKTSIGLLVFADKVKLQQELTQNGKLLKKEIGEWKLGMVGVANADQPFTLANKIFSQREAPKYIIVLTDGVWSNRKIAIAEANNCKENDIEIIAIGFGGADKKFLKKIATSDENALLTNLENLVSSFSKIAQVLTESGNVSTHSNSSNKIQFFK